MGVRLFDEQQAGQYLRERFASREWWFLVAPGEMSTSAVGVIEERFYSGEHSGDLELITAMVPGFRMLGIFLAHKRRMSAEQLGQEMFAASGYDVPIEELRNHDLLVLSDPGMGAGEIALLYAGLHDLFG
jgi:hypothetical protein